MINFLGFISSIHFCSSCLCLSCRGMSGGFVVRLPVKFKFQKKSLNYWCSILMWIYSVRPGDAIAHRGTASLLFNWLAPGKFEWNFISMIDGWGISCEIALLWMSLYFTDEQSTLVLVMVWCRQATSHYRIYLNQCWHRSQSSYAVPRPQWVK